MDLVVVGDLPPAYFPAHEARTPAAILELYIEEMQLWVDAVKAGRPLHDLIPVETKDGSAPLDGDPKLAQILENRLRFLAAEILPEFA